MRLYQSWDPCDGWTVALWASSVWLDEGKTPRGLDVEGSFLSV